MAKPADGAMRVSCGSKDLRRWALKTHYRNRVREFLRLYATFRATTRGRAQVVAARDAKSRPPPPPLPSLSLQLPNDPHAARYSRQKYKQPVWQHEAGPSDKGG